MTVPVIREPQCKFCNWERRDEAEKVYAQTNSVKETHEWVVKQGFGLSYNAVWRHLSRHYKEEIQVEVVERHVQRIEESGNIVWGVVEECDAALATLRHTVNRLGAYFDQSSDEDMLEIAKTIARVTDAMVRQVDLKARILGYYSNHPAVNLVLVKEFKQQVDVALTGVPEPIRQRVLGLVEERAGRLPLGDGEETQRLEDIVAELEDEMST